MLREIHIYVRIDRFTSFRENIQPRKC